LGLVEFGRTGRERVFVLPLAAAVAKPTDVFQSQFAFLWRCQAILLDIDFLRVNVDCCCCHCGRQTSFFHHLGRLVLEFLQQFDFPSAIIMFFLRFLLHKEDVVIALANERVFDLLAL
jgi:hypothetical protein